MLTFASPADIGIHKVEFWPSETDSCLRYGGNMLGGRVDAKTLAIIIECITTFINFSAQVDDHYCRQRRPLMRPRRTRTAGTDHYSARGGALLQARGAEHAQRRTGRGRRQKPQGGRFAEERQGTTASQPCSRQTTVDAA
jgi:hypothetical protein